RLCVCVCVCVCRSGEDGNFRVARYVVGSDRVRGKVCVCVCVCMRVSDRACVSKRKGVCVSVWVAACSRRTFLSVTHSHSFLLISSSLSLSLPPSLFLSHSLSLSLFLSFFLSLSLPQIC